MRARARVCVCVCMGRGHEGDGGAGGGGGLGCLGGGEGCFECYSVGVLVSLGFEGETVSGSVWICIVGSIIVC